MSEAGTARQIAVMVAGCCASYPEAERKSAIEAHVRTIVPLGVETNVHQFPGDAMMWTITTRLGSWSREGMVVDDRDGSFYLETVEP